MKTTKYALAKKIISSNGIAQQVVCAGSHSGNVQLAVSRSGAECCGCGNMYTAREVLDAQDGPSNIRIHGQGGVRKI